MGLDKIAINTKYSPSTNIKISAIMAAMGRAKMYELLHKQIWRKSPINVAQGHKVMVHTYSVPGLTSYKGRPVAFIDKWDIKNPSGAPYSHDVPSGMAADQTTGLNQLFTSQDPFKPFVGDVADDGIYHDDCYITPKMMFVSAEHDYYVYTHIDFGEYGAAVTKYFRERDDNGTVVINSVALENYVATVAGKSQDRYRLLVNYTSGAVDRIDLDSGSYNALMDKVEKRKSHEVLRHAEEYKIAYDFGSHGAVVWEQVIDMPYQFTTTSSQKTTKEDGWIRQYSDGTVIQYRPLEVEYWGDGMDNIIPGHYKILPMVYTDTGDLTMPVADFVKNWGDYFELVVHEDSEWWESLLAPIIAVVSIVAAVFAYPLVVAMGPVIGPIMGGVLIAGTAMSVMGTLGGNAKLGALGGLLAGVAGLAGAVAQAGRTALYNLAVTEGLPLGGAAQIASEATLGQVFSGFMSAGFDNLAKIGSAVLKVVSSVTSLTAETPDVEQVDTTEPVDASEISFTTTLGKDDSEYDVFGQMGKQFEMY